MSTAQLNAISAIARQAAVATLRSHDPLVKFAAAAQVPEGVVMFMSDLFQVPPATLVKAAADDQASFYGLVGVVKQAADAGIMPPALLHRLRPAVQGCPSLAQALTKIAGMLGEGGLKPEALGAPPMAGLAAGALAAPAGMPSPDMHGLRDKLHMILTKIKANPGKSALLGLGGAGAAGAAGGYGLAKLTGGGKKKDEKEAGDKAAFFQHAAEVKRHNARVIFNRYLEKVALDVPVLAPNFARVQASLILGNNINVAMRQGFPKMAVEKRVLFADRLTKRAMDSFLKAADSACCSNVPKTVGTQSHKTFHGKPKEGHEWMKQHA